MGKERLCRHYRDSVDTVYYERFCMGRVVLGESGCMYVGEILDRLSPRTEKHIRACWARERRFFILEIGF